MNRCKKCNSFLSFGKTEYCTNCKKEKNSKIKFLFIGIGIGILGLLLLAWLNEVIDDMSYTSKRYENDFTDVVCSRENNLISCNVIVNKEDVKIDHISVFLEYDGNIEYTDYISDNTATITHGKNDDKQTLHISTYNNGSEINNNNVLTLLFNINKELDNSTITVENIYITSYLDDGFIHYDSDEEKIINVNDLLNENNLNNDFTSLNCDSDNNQISCKLFVDKENYTIDSLSFDVRSNTILDNYTTQNSSEIISKNIYKLESSYEIKNIYVKNKENFVISFNFSKKNVKDNFELEISNLKLVDNSGNVYHMNSLLATDYNK